MPGINNYIVLTNDGGGGRTIGGIYDVVDKKEQTIAAVANGEYSSYNGYKGYEGVKPMDKNEPSRVEALLSKDCSDLDRYYNELIGYLKSTNSNRFYKGEPAKTLLSRLGGVIEEFKLIQNNYKKVETDLEDKLRRYNSCLEEIKNAIPNFSTSGGSGNGPHGPGHENLSHNLY